MTNPTNTEVELPRQQATHSAADHAGAPRQLEPQATGPSPSSGLSLADHAEALAEAAARQTWNSLKDEPHLAEPTVRRALANHFWCNLFLAFAGAISDLQQTLNEIPSSTKAMIKERLRSGDHSSNLDAALTDVIVNKIVDEAWSSLQAALTVGSPLLTAATSKQSVQAFQLLAVFSCPDPDRHRAVRLEAFDPLARDTAGAVSDEAKERLLDAFLKDNTTRREPIDGSLSPGQPFAGAT